MNRTKRTIIVIGAIALIAVMFSPLFRPSPAKSTDILIISPHPDDAALCCGGLIQQSIALGKTVRVVNVTDGEGYKEATALLTHKTVDSITPEDMLALGRTRQDEEHRAMNMLGIPSSSVVFLGYPDGFLDEVHKNEGSPPFTSPYTNLSKTLEANHVFSRTSAVADIASLISSLKPAQIIIPTRTDDALDHVVTNLFVTDAMKLTEYSGTLLRYVIHSASQSAAPIFRVSLTDAQIKKKKEAIEAYVSQTAVDGDYLKSFAQNDELFY